MEVWIGLDQGRDLIRLAWYWRIQGFDFVGLILENLGCGEIRFEKLGTGKIILEVEGSRAKVIIGVLKKKLGVDGDRLGEGDMGLICALGPISEMR